MYDLNKTDRRQLGKVKEIVDTSNEGGIYILTGSGEEEIEDLADELDWDSDMMEQVFCYTDPVTLKTIVRANPGLVLIQNGTIIRKNNLRQL